MTASKDAPKAETKAPPAKSKKADEPEFDPEDPNASTMAAREFKREGGTLPHPEPEKSADV